MRSTTFIQICSYIAPRIALRMIFLIMLQSSLVFAGKGEDSPSSVTTNSSVGALTDSPASQECLESPPFSTESIKGQAEGILKTVQKCTPPPAVSETALLEKGMKGLERLLTHSEKTQLFYDFLRETQKQQKITSQFLEGFLALGEKLGMHAPIAPNHNSLLYQYFETLRSLKQTNPELFENENLLRTLVKKLGHPEKIKKDIDPKGTSLMTAKILSVIAPTSPTVQEKLTQYLKQDNPVSVYASLVLSTPQLEKGLPLTHLSKLSKDDRENAESSLVNWILQNSSDKDRPEKLLKALHRVNPAEKTELGIRAMKRLTEEYFTCRVEHICRVTPEVERELTRLTQFQDPMTNIQIRQIMDLHRSHF